MDLILLSDPYSIRLISLEELGLRTVRKHEFRVYDVCAEYECGALMSKNIVICCDETGNEFGDRNSNVVQFIAP